MTQTIVRMFDHPNDAFQATKELQRIGIPHSDISVVANNSEGWYDEKDGVRPDRLKGMKDVDRDGKDDRVEGAEKGAGTGAVLGGGAGLLAGLGMLAIPGLGPIVAAGWLAATATGAVAGAASGGVVGGLLGALGKDGVSEEDAHVYAEGVRRGGSVLSVRVPDGRTNEVEGVLRKHAGMDASMRSSVYRDGGWSEFDDTAPPYTADQIADERQRYPATPR
jgi:hypothetical protein